MVHSRSGLASGVNGIFQGGATPSASGWTMAAGWATVAGIARDGKYNAVNEPDLNYLSVPIFQSFRPDVSLVVRTAGEPAAVFGSAQRAVHALHANLPLNDVMTIEEHLRSSVFIRVLPPGCWACSGAWPRRWRRSGCTA